PPDAPPIPCPRRRRLRRARPRRRRGGKPGLEGHGAGANRRDRRHPARRDEPGHLDGALPHRRAPRERDDVQLQRRPGGRSQHRVKVSIIDGLMVVAALAAGLWWALSGRRRPAALEALSVGALVLAPSTLAVDGVQWQLVPWQVL